MGVTKKAAYIVLYVALSCFVKSGYCQERVDTIYQSTPDDALRYLAGIKSLEQSKYWPNVDPELFLSNLRTFSIKPLAFYEGSTTNFCSYSALTYIPLQNNPLGFCRFMVNLYKYGKALMGKVVLSPGKAVRMEAGQLKYKGALDINPAGQMWFLTLADHFKGYLNIFKRNFKKGGENTLWASTNYAKFNRMLRRLFEGKVTAIGSDLIRPHVDVYAYLKEKLQTATVFVYLNNKKLRVKAHTQPFIKTPTHYVLLTGIDKLADGNIQFVYWDYGLLTLQQVSPAFLKSIVYGITTWNPKKKDTE